MPRPVPAITPLETMSVATSFEKAERKSPALAITLPIMQTTFEQLINCNNKLLNVFQVTCCEIWK